MAHSEENSSNNHSQFANSDPQATEALEDFLRLLMELQTTKENSSINPKATSIKPEADFQNSNSHELIEISIHKPPASSNSPAISLPPQENLKPDKNSQNPFNSSEKQTKKTSTDEPIPWELHQTIDTLKEKLEKLEKQVYQPTELIDPIIPLITELLNHKNIESQDSLLKAIVPILDRAIQERSQQDTEKMGEAIATILPTAIAREIKQSPTEIAKAIAPEMAIAIQEQIRLDPDSIAKTLGPEMGEAIKNQIRVEQDAMVDALYPVIGSTISKYMVELVKTINDKVESAFSLAGIKRKIRAKIQGVSEAELILQEAVNYEVQAVFLIHKASGLVIREVHPALDLRLEADMLAGLLTAIRSFVNEGIVQPGEFSELHQIEYDASQIILEVAGYCYIAAVVKGAPSKQFTQRLKKTLGRIVLKYGKLISVYDGNPATIPNAVELLLEKLTKTEARQKSSKPPYAVLFIVACLLAIWGFIIYRAERAYHIESQTSNALDATPELSIYRIVPEVRGDNLTLTGRVPNEYLKDKAGKIVATVAPNLRLNNQIIAVNVPVDPVQTAGEVQRVTWIFNQKDGIAITSKHDYGTKTVTLEGIVPDFNDAEEITQAFMQIPGVEAVSNIVQIRPILETRIYFESGSTQYSSPDIANQLRAIRQFLDRNPKVYLRIIGHTDYKGPQAKNQTLGLQRARLIQQALIAEQINPAR
ncbi:MAG: BON domain-containing protein, partial [Hydrococcus sp. Prado102]|nr:BON domain-containing protein [Hydrococcus sp. Prado102]